MRFLQFLSCSEIWTPATVSLCGPLRCWSTLLKKIFQSLDGVCTPSWIPPSTHLRFTSSRSPEPFQPIQMIGKCFKANVCSYLLTTSYVPCHTSREFKGVMCDTRGLCSWPLQSLLSLGSSFPISEVGVSLFRYVVLPVPSLKGNPVREWTRSFVPAQSLNFSISPADHSPKAFQLSCMPRSQRLNRWIPSSALARSHLNEVTQRMASRGWFSQNSKSLAQHYMAV